MSKKFLVAAGVVVASIAPALALPTAAHAVTCASGGKYTAPNIANSTRFDATPDCDGVYAGTAASRNDYVRGRFYKDGGWDVSSYGYVYVRASSDGYDKIVGNTVTGRDIKGQANTYSQSVGYLY